MSDIATLFAAGMKSNPYREQAKMLTDSANAIPNDAYGYGAIARIPSMLFAGQKMGEAQQYDEQMNAQATKEAKATRFFGVFTKLLANPQTEGMAVKMWNETAPGMLGINQKIEAAKLSPNATTVKLQNGGWWGIDHRTQQPIVYDTDQGGWRSPTQGDFAAFQKNTAAEGTPEGRRIYGELQDTSSIPNTPMQDPNNPDVTRSAQDIYAGAMQKNLAQESPVLAEKFSNAQLKEREISRKEDAAPKISQVSLGNNTIQDMQWNAATGQYDTPVGKPYSRFKPGGESEKKDRIRTYFDQTTGDIIDYNMDTKEVTRTPGGPKKSSNTPRIGGGVAPSTSASGYIWKDGRMVLR